MKPTAQISSKSRPVQGHDGETRDPQSFPPTDYNFQLAMGKAGSSSAAQGSRFIKLDTSFRHLSSGLAAETRRDYVSEAVLFTPIAAVAAWSIITMGIAVSRMVRGW